MIDNEGEKGGFGYVHVLLYVKSFFSRMGFGGNICLFGPLGEVCERKVYIYICIWSPHGGFFFGTLDAGHFLAF